MNFKNNIFFSIAASALFMAAVMTGCQKDENVGVVGVCPLVISTEPANLATGVPRNQVIKVTFNEEMDPATIKPSSFSLQSSAGKVSGALTYETGKATMTFTPAGPLDSSTTYTGIVESIVKDKMGNYLQTDYIWTFSTGGSIAPMVVSTDPMNNATGVFLNKVVSATFNMGMDAATINSSTFTLEQGANAITGSVSYSGNTASFTPSAPLLPNSVYTATITTGAKNTGGTAIATNYVWTFTTGTLVAPTVTSTDPVNNATSVPLNKIITATFSEPMDPATINGTSFRVTEGVNLISGTVSYSSNTATFTPSGLLSPNKVYTGRITNSAKNVAGTPLVNDYTWSFTTEGATAPIVISTDPVDNETGVARNEVVTATFNMAMDPLTLNATTFTVMKGATPVAGSVSYSGNTATFTPALDLDANTLYTATITTGAKNLAGTPLSNDHVWSFTTETGLAPLIDLKSAEDFGILAYTGITNNAGFSEVRNMNVGIYPGIRSGVTGFPPGKVVNGAIYASDDLIPVGISALLKQAKEDLTDAYLAAEGATSPAPSTVSGDQGGKTLAPGIYKTTSTLSIESGDLTLDAQGDPNAVWIFQIASGFTTVGGAGGNVILSGGAQAKNVFWQVGSSATIGDGTDFYGNVLALTSITMNSDAVATGRMLAINGAVTMTSNNIINKP